MVHAQQSVGINFDAKCNMRCAHCCVSSSPDASANLNDELVDHILDDLFQNPEVREIGLTGGEPLIRKARTLEVMKRITDTGRAVTCVSNGFWAVTRKAADRVFAELEAAGLRKLTISYDDFHAPYIKPQRIKNLLEASRESNIHVILNMCVSRSNNSNALLEALGDSILGIQVTKFPAVPAGEARKFDESEFQRRPITEKMLRCPGLQVIYHNDGKVYPCCSPAIFDTNMTLGDVGAEPYKKTVEKIRRNALLGIMQREGFQWFIDAIREVNPSAPAATVTEVVSACELCSVIFLDEESIALIQPKVLAYFQALIPSHAS
ncbi:YydG family peptide radical SAM peptide maturase [Microbacteriaceae bacterium VKM Ac-2855]|nr:YydG family peptide radical SAM peptide maturase [Microbacteriaceae bacterium VKM Ac-2855]